LIYTSILPMDVCVCLYYIDTCSRGGLGSRRIEGKGGRQGHRVGGWVCMYVYVCVHACGYVYVYM